MQKQSIPVDVQLHFDQSRGVRSGQSQPKTIFQKNLNTSGRNSNPYTPLRYRSGREITRARYSKEREVVSIITDPLAPQLLGRSQEN